MNNKQTITILMVATLIITIIGGTLAYWNWQSTSLERTNVTFTVASGFSCGADGGGDITSSNVTLAPAACTNSTYAIKRTITVSTTQDAGKTIALDMWLKVNNIGSGLTGTHNFKYALTNSALGCDDESAGTDIDVIAEGDFYGASNGSELLLLDGKQYSQTTASDQYYLYIWLDSAETSATTQNQAFSMTIQGECTDELPANSYIYTVNIYDYDMAADTTVYIGQAIPAYTAEHYQFGTPAEAMASWTSTSVGAQKPFYLKHKVENGVVTESYVEFVIDANLKAQLTNECYYSTCEEKVAELTEDTFTLRGGIDESSSDDKSIYLANAREIYRAFGGYNCAANPNDSEFDYDTFSCAVDGLNVEVYDSGYVNVNDSSSPYCYIGNGSICNV